MNVRSELETGKPRSATHPGASQNWDSPESEQKRLQGLEDGEVVLAERPRRLFIEVASATKKMPLVDGKRLYTLTVHAKHWCLDAAQKVHVARYGFTVVPDFAGIAHAYCGSTLDACIGDLLPWFSKPRL